MSKIDDNAFNGLINIEELNLEHNKLKLKQNFFQHLTNLNVLHLNCNQLTNFPNMISLKNLTLLNLSRNQLTETLDLVVYVI